MTSPIIFKGSLAHLIASGGLEFNNGSTIKAGAVDPSAVATDGNKGDQYISTSTGFSYQKTDSGSTTNWAIIGTYDITTFAALTDLSSSSIASFVTSASGSIGLTAVVDVNLTANDTINECLVDVLPTELFLSVGKIATSDTANLDAEADGSSNYMAINVQKQGIADNASLSVNIETNNTPTCEINASTTFPTKTNNNATAATEILYGRTAQKYTGTAPSGTVAIDASKSGDLFYLANQTTSNITFGPKTAETFNNASTIIIPAKQTGFFTQCGDGLFSVQILGETSVPAGAGGELAKLGGRLFGTAVQVLSSGTTETTFYSYTVPANTLNTTTDSLCFRASGLMTPSAFTKQLRVYFGSTVIFDTTALAITDANSWVITGEVMQSGPHLQQCNVTFSCNSATIQSSASFVASAENETTPLALYVTGQVGTTGGTDIAGETFKVNFEAAN